MRGKKLSILIAVLLLATILMSACQPAAVEEPVTEQPVVEEPVEVEEPAEVEEPEVVEEPEPVDAGVLRIWGFYDLTNEEDGRAVTMKATIEDFQAETGIMVDYEQVAWDQMAAKVSVAAVAGGDLPDMIMSGYEYLQGMINAGALMDIYDEIAAADFYGDLNDFETNLNEIEGKRYAVGTFIGGGQWYYDTEIYPDGFPDTQEGWAAECSRLAPEGRYVATFYAGRAEAAMTQGLAPLVWSLGETLFDEEGVPKFDSDAVVQAIEFWRTMYADGCVPEVAWTGDWSATEAPFEDRSAGAYRGGTWSYIYVTGLQDRFEAGTVKIGNPPALTGGDQGYVFMNTETWALTSRAENVDNAIKFIEFFFNPDLLGPWANSNFGVPATATALENPIFDSQFYYDTLDNLTRNGHRTETSPYFNETMNSLAATVQDLVLNSDLDIREGLASLQNEMLLLYFD